MAGLQDQSQACKTSRRLARLVAGLHTEVIFLTIGALSSVKPPNNSHQPPNRELVGKTLIGVVLVTYKNRPSTKQ